MFDQRLNIWCKVEKAHGVGDRGPVFADAAGNIFLGEPEIAREAFVCRCFFYWVEVFPLKIFDERQLENFAIACLPHDDRSLGEPEVVCRPPPAFASNELEFSIDFANDERLDNSAFTDAFDEFLQVFSRELDARLERAWDDLVEGDLLNAFAQLYCGSRVGYLRIYKCVKSSAECLLCHEI